MSLTNKQTDFSFEAIGTRWNIILRQDFPVAEKQHILDDILSLIASFDVLYSRFRTDSQVIQMSQKVGEYSFPARDIHFLQLYQDLYDATNGQFTPLIGQVLADAGYDENYTLKRKKKLQVPPAWQEVLQTNFPKITLLKPSLLDFGAAGKGYLIDLVGSQLIKKNIHSFIIDAGGDILEKNPAQSSIRVGLENPSNTKQVIGVASIHNQSICGSAGNRRKWKDFNHIINPYTLKSPSAIAAIWVIADNAMLADALTTALYFVPPEKLSKYAFEYCILNSDFSLNISSDFSAEIFKVK